jgi:hypothetical protein
VDVGVDHLSQTYQGLPHILERFVGVRYADTMPTTSGSLQDIPRVFPGTVDTRFWPEGIEYIPQVDLIPEDSTSSGIFMIAQTENIIVLDPEMLQLEKAAEAGNERIFLQIEKSMEWENRPAKDILHAVQLALAAGAHLAARRIAAAGAAHYPEQAEIQKYAHILAAPQVYRREKAATTHLRSNRDWLMANNGQYSGQWVALKDGELVGAAATLQALKAQIGNTDGVLLTKVF